MSNVRLDTRKKNNIFQLMANNVVNKDREGYTVFQATPAKRR